MKEQIVFSIVIPVYNTVSELTRCVESIVISKFEQYELILVDDGSTDGSSKLCDELARKYEKIKVIHKENGGAAEARNVGILNAKGRYLLFVDSDDLLFKQEALTEVYNTYLIDKNPDVILCGVKIYRQDGSFVKERLPEVVSGTKKEKFRDLVKNNYYISAPYTKILNREFFIKNNLFFVDGLLCEDIEWSARIMLACKTIEVFPVSYYKRVYREEGSATANIGRENIVDILRQIKEGTSLIKETISDVEMQDIYYEYWAYQYAMLLGFFRKNKYDKEYKKMYQTLKEYRWLLKYDSVNKVKLVHVLTKICGLHSALFVMEQYMKIRK